MEVDYILGCAIELGELTALEETVLRRHPDAFAQLDQMLQSRQEFSQHFMQNTARDVLSRCTQLEQYFFSLCSTVALTWSMDAVCQRAESLIQSRIQHDLGVRDSLLTALFSELDGQRDTPVVKSEEDIGEGLIRDMLDEMLAPAMNRSIDDLELLEEALHWYKSDQGATFGRMLLGTDLPTSKLPAMAMARNVKEDLARREKRAEAKQRTAVERAKAAIKKATKLFQNLGQDTNLKLFVSGTEVTLSHPESRFKLIVKPLQVEGWLIDRTQHGRAHTPYELMLVTKEDVFLAKLCVYFNNTPVLDQLLALTFYVQSGEELQILQKANWFATGDWNDEKSALIREAYPQLESKIPRQMDTSADGRRIPINQQFDREEAHWAPFKGRVKQWVATWFEPISLEVAALVPELSAPINQLRPVPVALSLAA